MPRQRAGEHLRPVLLSMYSHWVYVTSCVLPCSSQAQACPRSCIEACTSPSSSGHSAAPCTPSSSAHACRYGFGRRSSGRISRHGCGYAAPDPSAIAVAGQQQQVLVPSSSCYLHVFLLRFTQLKVPCMKVPCMRKACGSGELRLRMLRSSSS
jgi:hypothetical protein